MGINKIFNTFNTITCGVIKMLKISEEFSTNLRQCLTDKQMTNTKLAEMLGVDRTSVQNWLKGNQPRDYYIEEMCKIFGVSVDWLTGCTQPNAEILSENIYMIPVFNSVSAGLGTYADSNIDCYRPAEITNPLEVRNYFYCRVVGDSMEPTIPDGSIILVHKQTAVGNGEVAVVILGDDNALVKRVVYGKDWVELRSENSDYETKRFERKEIEDVHIQGLVVEYTKPVK